MFKKVSYLVISFLFGYSSLANSVTLQPAPDANSDIGTVIVSLAPTFEGNVLGNDFNGNIARLNQSFVGRYGTIESFSTAGEFTYTLFDLPELLALGAGETVQDVYSYTLFDSIGRSSNATLTILISGNPQRPLAVDDNFTLVANSITSVSGNIRTNDTNGISAQIVDSPVSEFGFFVLQADGTFTYTLFDDSPNVVGLSNGEIALDSFDYALLAADGSSSIGTVNFQIIGQPVDSSGNIILNPPDDDLLDNVDVEFNNFSTQATPLNSARNIKGHLYDSSDRDWYSLNSSGDEIITLEVCPVGSSCFGKKSWVLYVFDSDLLTPAIENTVFNFSRRLDITGTVTDESGTDIIAPVFGQSDHLYLRYRTGFFEGALIGIVDPCFDTTNAVDIGVGPGARNYLIAISSPLRGDGDTSTDADDPDCGQGSVILEEPGFSAQGNDAEGNSKVYATTQETIIAFPFSDDQYAIKVTGTGVNPLLSAEAAAKSSHFDISTGDLFIPRVRVLNEVLQANLSLNLKQKKSSSVSSLEFLVDEISSLDVTNLVDTFQATYNPDNNQVLIPRVTDVKTGLAYSVVMKYYPETSQSEQWLEVIELKHIQ